MRRLALIVIFGAILLPAVASAQTSVTVLGLRSASADEAIATQVTDVLRRAAEAATSSGFTHTGRENTLSQMLIVFDCEEPTSSCMGEISESLNSQRLIYGLIEPESGRANSNYTVTLHFFNAQTGRVERDLQEVVERGMSSDQMMEPASRFYSALTGTVVRGELAIRSNVAGAQVLINNRAVGQTGAEPLVLRDLEPGELTVTVRSDGYAPFQQTVSVEAGQTQELMATLSGEGGGGTAVVGPVGDPGTEEPEPEPFVPVTPPPRRSLTWLGWTLFGTAAVFGGIGLWQSLVVNAHQSDLQPYRESWPDQRPGGQETDVCARAANNDFPTGTTEGDITIVNDACDVSTPQALQFVFYGLSVAALVASIIVLVRESRAAAGGDEARGARRFRLAPMVTSTGAALSAELSF